MSAGRDPRPAQIAVLGALLLWGVLGLDFELSPLRAAATLAAALATQAVCGRLDGRPRFDPRSALISGLSLCLLLRTEQIALAMAAAVLAIASKFALRVDGKHVWNPTCLAIVVLLLVSDGAWVSAGQWGSAALFAFAAAGLGMLVVHRAERSDVTWAFLASHAALLFGRAAWLGDPWSLPLHALGNGALLIFAFFMISDPRTLPDSRRGRVVYAAAVALGGFAVQYGLYRPNGLLFSLAAAAPLVPLLDRLFPGRRHAWAGAAASTPDRKEIPMSRLTRRLAPLAALALAWLPAGAADAFCGFYVARADAKLFNRASQVVLVRDGDRTVITMSNDFQGDPTEFAMVVPVPTFVEREQINVGKRTVIDHLDAFTSPRLVEYYDPDPCARMEFLSEERSAADALRPRAAQKIGRARASGVVIEAAYTVGEYDILILSAEQSDGLARWLRDEGYRLPDGAEPVLRSYLRQGMRFFVAKVNLAEHSKLGFSYLRPLQIAYESPKFMLPIRLGTLNANGAQELFVYTLTRQGRVETTNYRSVKLPTDVEIPTFVKTEFGEFYGALFDEQVRRERMRTVFTEYAWDMGWCDPCAADPLSDDELRSLGVFWLGDEARRRGGPRNVFVTRLHARYDAETFPADLVFQETSDRSNFQGRYVLRHPFPGPDRCPAAEAYRREVRERQEREARQLASLTRWSLAEIRRKIGLGDVAPAGGEPWWRRIWER